MGSGSMVKPANWQGFGTDRWLCTALVGNSTDGGFTFAVHYSFVLNERIWKARVVYVDSSGRVPTDLENNVGDKLVKIYHRNEFANLELT